MNKIKVCTFGGSGFLGSHVSDVLTKRGFDVTIYDTVQSPYLQSNQQMVIGYVLDYYKVNDVIKCADIVYNFSAVADIDKVDPLKTISTNILGNSYILNACCNHNIKRFVFASSIYVNSNHGSFYASSKRACEDFIHDYNKEYKLPYTILRYGSIYGPRANKFNWIRKAIKQALTENKIVRKGDGEEIREYIHVKDAASLSVDILSNEYINKCITITGNQQLKVKDLHIMIKEILNKDIKLEYVPATDWRSHYDITPYTFKTQETKNLTSNQYKDMGSGLLECIQEIYKELKNETKV